MIYFINNLKILKSKKDIIFFSEGKFQWKFFENLILDLLEKTDFEILFLTSEKNDQAFNIKDAKFKSVYIGKGFFRSIILGFLKTKFLFTSTPDLGSSKFRKSPFVDKYIYVPHSVGSTHLTYNEKAFDNFDVILCVGEPHEKEIKIREEKFKLKKKELIPFGYPWIKNLKKSLEKFDKFDKKDKKNVLYAPSWGVNSSLEFLDINLIYLLIERDCKVYFKPHPMSYNFNKKIIAKIKKKFSRNKNFTFVNLDDISLFFKTELLITDWSGISFEYFFAKENSKIIFLETPIRAVNKNYKELGLRTIEEQYRKELGIITKLDILEIQKKIDIAIKTEAVKNSHVSNIEKKLLFNYDKCFPYLLEYIKKTKNL